MSPRRAKQVSPTCQVLQEILAGGEGEEIQGALWFQSHWHVTAVRAIQMWMRSEMLFESHNVKSQNHGLEEVAKACRRYS